VDGQTTLVGIFFHLQETSGKIVAVNAGEAVLSPTGDILNYPQNQSGRRRCPLHGAGGHPAELMPAWCRALVLRRFLLLRIPAGAGSQRVAARSMAGDPIAQRRDRGERS
jgi:hypothetical protein